ncbi:MAG: pyridoxal phosphate-dependent aminotransferase [Candidatus Bathyarchaeota archaeon]|nr:MAG: pyridoxal phosphate-dependent aminotransferase [Candidatus Bathyarchaeota archaeon]
MKASRKVGRIKPSAIRRMLELSAGLKDVVHLEHGEPNFATPEHVIAAAIEAMNEGCTHYTDISGTLELRQAIAEKLAKENGIDVDPQTEVTVTSGSQEAMLNAALGFLDRGDEALVIDPYYPAQFEDTLLAEAVPVKIPLNATNNYRLEMDALEREITRKTKMIWICNPSNPTGHVFSKRDLEILADVAERHDLIVFVDEIYEKIVYNGAKHISLASLPRMENRTITVNGFSKAYAMTGWRIGYMVAEKELSATLRTMHYYDTLCPNIISQKAALAALTGPQNCVDEMVAEYNRRRLLVAKQLGKLESVTYPVPEGAFYVFPNLAKLDKSDETLALDLLTKAKVVTVPGSGFGKAGEGHIRISYSSDYEQVEEGMKRKRYYKESRF